MNLDDQIDYLAELMNVVWSDDVDGPHYFGVLMRGYFDESGIHDSSRITTIAGWMFTAEEGPLCLKEWGELLATKGLEEFHAADFDHFAKANKWTLDDYNEFVDGMVNVLGKRAWFGLSASVVAEAYEALPIWLKTRIGKRYHLRFYVLMHDLSERMHSVISRRLPFMAFERKDKVIGCTLANFAEIWDKNSELGSMIFDTVQHIPLLQVADFVVYEVGRWIDGGLYTHEPPRHQIEALAAKQREKDREEWLHYSYHDSETLQHLAEILESGTYHPRQWWPDSWLSRL
jgi:hypothetical protein